MQGVDFSGFQLISQFHTLPRKTAGNTQECQAERCLYQLWAVKAASLG